MAETETSGWSLVVLGVFLLVGYAAHVLGQKMHVPRVTLLLLLGVLAGPAGFAIVPDTASSWFPLVAKVALSVVGFLLGGHLLSGKHHRLRKHVLALSLAETLGAALAVFLGLLVIGLPVPLALLLAGVAPATAPAATADVIREGRFRGPVTNTVLGVVAIDDAYAIVLFSVMLAVAQAAAGQADNTWELVALGAWEVLGAIVLGAVLGWPMAWLTGRVRPGEATLVEALGFVLACGGLASVLGVSYLLACMVLGVVVTRKAAHHRRPFHAIEGISQPFLVTFFLLAGFALEPTALHVLGVAGVVYVLARTSGKLLGVWVGARLDRAPAALRRHVGPCLLPQAGVAIGLGLLASERFPEYAGRIVSLLVATTVVFEIVGPIATRIALSRAGELPHRED